MALRFGVIGATSTVARRAVVPAILATPSAALVAVASRSLGETASDGEIGEIGELAAGVARYGGYDELLADPAVDAVYVPLPNSMHREWTERAAAAGKHVLCEKPLAACERDAQAMADACSAAGVVLMEAYMTLHHPRAMALATLVAGGALGPVRFARAAFTGVLQRADDHRWRPEMGGGALLDVGIYCLAPILEMAGVEPREVARMAASAHRAPLGVDASFAGWIALGSDAAATIECSFEAPERQLLELVGETASVSIDRAFTPGVEDTTIRLRHRDGREEEIESSACDPYQAMVEHFVEVVRGHVTSRRPPQTSVALAALIDRLSYAASSG